MNCKKAGRQSTGAMNLLASAAEDNEAFENTLTSAQIQQLQLQQQLALQQPQLQVTFTCSCDAVLHASVEVLLLSASGCAVVSSSLHSGHVWSEQWCWVKF